MTNFARISLPVSFNLYQKKIDSHLSLVKIIHLMTHDHSLQLQIKAIRQKTNAQAQKHLKNSLPLFFPAIDLATHKRIDDNQQVKSTGLIHFDIDIYEHAQTELIFKQLVEEIPFLVYAFRSPRKGLKFSIASDLFNDSKATIRHHYSLVYNAVKKILQKKIPSLAFDDSNERISQSCFFSYDPQLYINYTPDIFLTQNIIAQGIATKRTAQKELLYTHYKQDIHTDNDKQSALEALTYIPVNLSYHDRFKINLAITSVFGLEAQQILFQHWQHENPVKLRKDIFAHVNYALKHPIMITTGTLFYYARQYGFNF